MAPVHLESVLALSVAQVLDAENESEEGGEVYIVTELQADKLQICLFVDSLVGPFVFAGVIGSVEMLASVLLPERRMQAFELTVPAHQVKICFVCNDVLKTLHEYLVWLHVCVCVCVCVCWWCMAYSLCFGLMEREQFMMEYV